MQNYKSSSSGVSYTLIVLTTLLLTISSFSLLLVPSARASGTASFANTVTLTSDGAAPFDANDNRGNDSSPNNAIIRVGDTALFRMNISLNDPGVAVKTLYKGLKIDLGPLPLGFDFADIPIDTGLPCVITGDGLTTPQSAVCDLPDLYTAESFIYTTRARANINAKHDDTVNIKTKVYNSPDTTNPATIVSPTVKVTKKTLQYDISKTYKDNNNLYPLGTLETFNLYKETVGGVDGYTLPYFINLNSYKNTEDPVFPIVFYDDFSGIPGATFQSCNPYTTYITCEVDPTNSKRAKITMTKPLTNAGYGIVANGGSASYRWGSGDLNAQIKLNIYYPKTSYDANPDALLSNKIVDFKPIGSESNLPNYTDFTLEPDYDKSNLNANPLTKSQNESVIKIKEPIVVVNDPIFLGRPSKIDIQNTKPLAVVNGIGKFLDTVTYASSNYYPSNLAKDRNFYSLNSSVFPGDDDVAINKAVLCTVVDPTQMRLRPLADAGGKYSFINFSSNGSQSATEPNITTNYGNFVVEYSNNADCKNSLSTGTWALDPTTLPGGVNTVTSIRYRNTSVITKAQAQTINPTTIDPAYPFSPFYVTLVVGLEHIADVTSPICNTAYADFNKSKNKVGLESYIKGDAKDCVYIELVKPSPLKSIVNPKATYEAGDIITFKIKDKLIADVSHSVSGLKLVDVYDLDKSLTYIEGSAKCVSPNDPKLIQPISCEPTTNTEILGYGKQLVWNFNDIADLKPYEDANKTSYTTEILVSFRVNKNLINQRDYANLVATKSNQYPIWNYNSVYFKAKNNPVLSINKTSPTPFTDKLTPFEFGVSMVNLSTIDSTQNIILDWLPFNGDTRVPKSQFNGIYKLLSLELNPTATNNVTGTKYFTKYNQLLLTPTDFNPQYNNPVIKWCLESEFGQTGCPATIGDVTGFKVFTPVLKTGEQMSWNMKIQPSGNIAGDIYTNQAYGTSIDFTLPIISNNLPVRIGTGKIGSVVWYDANANGVLDNGEKGIQGAEVQIIGADGVVIDTRITDVDGKYLFANIYTPNVGSEAYNIKVIPPNPNLSQTYDADGLTTPLTSSLSLDKTNNINLVQNFGFVLGSIGDTVYKDVNANGVFDPIIDMGILGATVELRDENGVLLATKITDLNGKYLFEDLPLNKKYIIKVLGNQGVPFNDYDGITTPNSSTTTLSTTNINDLNQDFGYASGSIGDKVYNDLNANGIFDTGDTGIKDINLVLYDTVTNTILATTKTDANGNYLFTDLPLGKTYEIRINGNPGVPFADSDGTSTPNKSKTTLSATNINDLKQDFGYASGSVGDLLYEDINNNGIFDAGDKPLKDIQVFINEEGGSSYGSTTTDVNGKYLFSNLPLNKTYRVTVGYVANLSPVSDADGIDTPNYSILKLDSTNINDTKQDFGFGSGSVGDTVYHDVNLNGIFDTGDIPLEGITVSIIPKAGGTPIRMKTDANGKYLFTGLAYNLYKVEIITPPIGLGAIVKTMMVW
jgi:SdrD B-like domain